MGTIIPGAGGVATEDVSAEPDVAIGDKVRELMTRKGVRIISPIVSQAAQGDAISTANLVGVLSERDSQVAANYAAWVYLFNGTTMDRLRGDTNGLQAQGPAASDDPELGNPLQIGGSVDNTDPASAAEGDVRRFRVSPLGRQLTSILGGGVGDGESNRGFLTEIDGTSPGAVTCSGFAPDGLFDRIRTLGDVAQDGLGQLCVTPAVPGAGVVLPASSSAAASATRATIATPTAGTRMRLVSLLINYDNTAAIFVEVYFGTGANYDTTPSKRIHKIVVDIEDTPNGYANWPDGAGPVGAVDDVLSLRSSAALGNLNVIAFLREE